MNKSKIATIVMAIIAAWLILTSCATKAPTKSKPLNRGWYSYRALCRAGYTCTPFKGRHYINPTSDSARVDITPKF